MANSRAHKQEMRAARPAGKKASGSGSSYKMPKAPKKKPKKK